MGGMITGDETDVSLCNTRSFLFIFLFVIRYVSPMGRHSNTDIPARLSEHSRRRRARQSKRRNEQFLRGPISLAWLCAAASLPGKALAVALATLFKSDVEKCDSVSVSPALLQRFGVSRQAGYRALGVLEEAKLVSVDRCRGRCTRVRINGARPISKGCESEVAL